MIQSKAYIPKTIFKAQKIIQNARYYDYQDQYQQAIINFMQAAKIIINLLKKYPSMPFHRQFAYEAQLCLLRVKQLNLCLIYPIQSSSCTTVTTKAEKNL